MNFRNHNASPTIPTSRARRLRRSAFWAAPLALALALGLSACGSSAVTSSSTPKSSSAAGDKQDVYNGADPLKAETSSNGIGMVLHVTNNSRYNLTWVGMNRGPDPASTPLSVIPPGGTDRIEWTHAGSGGLEIAPEWQAMVGTTSHTVYPAFGVPSIGSNVFSCTTDDMSKGSPVGPSQCNIGHGWDPDGQVIFVNS